MTKIEWTEKTWNPIVGCSIVSPGCTNCYAMRMAHRLEAMSDGKHWPHGGERGLGMSQYTGTTKVVNGNPVWTGKLGMVDDYALTAPLRRKKSTMYFVNSMGDLFHEDCPDEWIDRVFAVMALCPQHTFQLLTKRAERMRRYMDHISIDRVAKACPVKIDDVEARLGALEWPIPNIWLGISCEDQTRAEERIPHLLETSAAVRFISAEPLLGQINLLDIAKDGYGGNAIYSRSRPRLDWVIAGGESGRGARPMHPDWARSLRDQCQAAGVAYFFKQWGEWGHDERVGRKEMRGKDQPHAIDERWSLIRVGKKRAGRLLDGRTWDEMPERAA